MKTSTKKTTKALLALSILAATGAANAASYDFSGTGTTTALGGAVTLSNLSYTGTGTVNDTGGIFNDALFTYTQHVTSPLQAGLSAFITGSMSLSATGAIVDTYSGCTGTSSVCDAIAPAIGVPQSYSASPYNLSNLSSLTWSATTYSTAPGFGTTTTVSNFVATPVPVPAAAWLFGSGLLSLVARRRRTTAA
jgi:hypothetical protein